MIAAYFVNDMTAFTGGPAFDGVGDAGNRTGVGGGRRMYGTGLASRSVAWIGALR